MRALATLLVPALVPACASSSSPEDNNVGRDIPIVKYEEKIKCSDDLCLINDLPDRDGDGVADVDELAAGTDPKDGSIYPTTQRIADLLGLRQLPSFETGNSMLIVIPTRLPDGLPAFGGDAVLPSRKSALDRAGIKLPDGFDLSNGLSITIGLGTSDMSFHGLFGAITKGRSTEARGVGGAMASSSEGGSRYTDVQTVYSHKDASKGTEISQYTAYDTRTGKDVTINYRSDSSISVTEIHADDGSFTSRTTSNKDPSGITVTKTTTDTSKTEQRSLGPVTTTQHTETTTTTSSDGKSYHKDTTTTTTVTYPDGRSESHTSTKSETCNDGQCQQGSDPSQPAGELPPDDGTATALYDPDYDGSVAVSPALMHSVLVARGTNVDVVNSDNVSVYDFTFDPKTVSNKWGPIALFSGDEDQGQSRATFVHVPSAQPEFDPNLSAGAPLPAAPPDGTCTYCFQP